MSLSPNSVHGLVFFRACITLTCSTDPLDRRNQSWINEQWRAFLKGQTKKRIQDHSIPAQPSTLMSNLWSITQSRHDRAAGWSHHISPLSHCILSSLLLHMHYVVALQSYIPPSAMTCLQRPAEQRPSSTSQPPALLTHWWTSYLNIR